jgi:hypothetical protein
LALRILCLLATADFQQHYLYSVVQQFIIQVVSRITPVKPSSIQTLSSVQVSSK